MVDGPTKSHMSYHNCTIMSKVQLSTGKSKKTYTELRHRISTTKVKKKHEKNKNKKKNPLKPAHQNPNFSFKLHTFLNSWHFVHKSRHFENTHVFAQLANFFSITQLFLLNLLTFYLNIPRKL